MKKNLNKFLSSKNMAQVIEIYNTKTPKYNVGQKQTKKKKQKTLLENNNQEDIISLLM
jgi:hypothetical protein